MTEIELLERRVTALEQEVEGEKVVTRYILEQVRRNGDDLAALRGQGSRMEGRLDIVEARLGKLDARLDRFDTEFPTFRLEADSRDDARSSAREPLNHVLAPGTTPIPLLPGARSVAVDNLNVLGI